MPFSFMRRLSVQPEESGTEQECESIPPLDPDGPVMPLSLHKSSFNPPSAQLPTSCILEFGEVPESSYLRKLSICSFKSTSSVSSTCSAPGGIASLRGPGHCSSSLGKGETFDMHHEPMSRRVMTSRPSFISLCSIVSETSDVPKRSLPAPLQVELDLMQRSGIEGDEPKCRSHLPILRCASDYDINQIGLTTDGQQSFYRQNAKKGVISGIKTLPNRMRKMSTEKNRFDIYSISDETREQLKRLYVY